jgi:hypothetical protein
MSDHNQIRGDDLIFYSSGENIYSGGFSVDSLLMKGGVSPMSSISDKQFESNSTRDFSSIFGKNYAIPPMWFLSPSSETMYKTGGANYEFHDDDQENTHGVIEEDLHDKLLKILEASNSSLKRRTSKFREKKQRTTKRNTKAKTV